MAKLYNKEILSGNHAQISLIKGVNELANAVKSTLGPCGRNVIIDIKDHVPIITKDGVTVANSVKFENTFENMGAQLVKQVSSKANSEAGDGTTTSTVLAQAILMNNFNYRKNKSSYTNPIQIQRGISHAVNDVVQGLKDIAIPVTDSEQIERVATISANGDTKVGSILSQAIDSVGKDGVITLETTLAPNTSLSVVNGIEFDRGYLSPYFVNKDKKVLFDDSLILFYHGNIDDINEIVPILEHVNKNKTPLLIVCDNISDIAMNTIIQNVSKGVFKAAVVKSPYHGEYGQQVMEDIATLTNGVVFSETKGDKLTNITVSDLGKAKSIKVTEHKTTVIGHDLPEVEQRKQERIDSILAQSEDEELSSEDKQLLKNRAGSLSSGVAVIKVGAKTDIELNELYDRIEDALNATRAAVQEGIVAGGGTALAYVSSKLKKALSEDKLDLTDQELLGYEFLLNACFAPMRQIANNAGYEAVKVEHDLNIGFNPLTGEYVNMVDIGVIDPVKVTRCALESAASIAGTMVTTSVMIGISKDDDTDDFDYSFSN